MDASQIQGFLKNFLFAVWRKAYEAVACSILFELEFFQFGGKNLSIMRGIRDRTRIDVRWVVLQET